MVIKSIELLNYRNYSQAAVEFDDHVNIFYGDNAQGKTNLLEAIYLCGSTKSHRGTKDRDIIRFGEEEAHIKMILEKAGYKTRIDMHLKKNKSKGIAVDGLPLRRASELFGNAYMVFFSPEDMQIIKNGPAERRRFIDTELCQLKKLYIHSLVSYNKVLINRNQMLKDYYTGRGYEEYIDISDEQLCKYGCELIRFRREFIDMLRPLIQKIHSDLSGGKEHLDILYEPDVTEEDFAEKLKKRRDREIYQKMTLTGPHRDDINFLINDVDVRKYGSQGQQRTVALSLKMAEIEIVKRVTKEIPILLLDDVLSELDVKRQNYLLKSIKDVQTFITCTGLDEFIKNRFHIDRVFNVQDGEVSVSRPEV